MTCRMAPAGVAVPDPETDFVSPISERIGIFTEADITERAKRRVIEALGARKIADPAPRCGYYRVEATWERPDGSF